MRHLAALLGLVLVGLPLVLTPSWIVAAPGALAALLIAAGTLAFSISLLTVGIVASLLEYTLALWIGMRPLDPWSAVAIGAALALLLQVVDFVRRFRGAAVDGGVITSQLHSWLHSGILGVTLGLAVGALAAALTPALTPATSPVLAAGGTVIAIAAVTHLLLRAAPETEQEPPADG